MLVEMSPSMMYGEGCGARRRALELRGSPENVYEGAGCKLDAGGWRRA